MKKREVYVTCERCLHRRLEDECYERHFENALNGVFCDACMEAMLRDGVIVELSPDSKVPHYEYIVENIYKTIAYKEAKISRYKHDILRLNSVLKTMSLPT